MAISLCIKGREEMSEKIIIKPSVQKRFDSFMVHGRVLFFSAPCGFGKTVLADALLRGRNVLRQSAAAPDWAIPSSAQDWDILLIDDLQLMQEEAGQQALCELIRSSPERRFVLLSRGVPPGCLTAFQYTGLMTVLEADDHSPFKGLCGAGVAFKLCAALDGCPPEEMLEYCGDLAAVGTVADVMPLTGENRTIVKAGLRQLQNTDRPGFCALLEEVGLAGKPVTAENISYAIAPRLNAAGRMDSAVTALQLVLCEDEDRAVELAHKLSDINIQRQETEMEIVKAAQELLDAEPERLEDRVILLWGKDWHPGVIGIVASRLVEKTGRPVIVVSVDEHGEGKGSGRSVQGFNLHECIASCADILLRFGGHAMAAGLSVREEDLQTLRQRLNDWAARECPVLRTPPLECDLSVHLDRLTVESVRRLDQLAPYGADNPSPVFVLEMAVVEGVYAVSEGKHCRLRLRQGNSSIYAVWFGMHPEQVPYSTGDVVDAAISLSVYDSPRGAQLSGRIIELHPAGLGNTAAEQAALVQALRRGTPLTPEQKESIAPERSHIITVYRELQARRWHAEDLQPLFAKLGEENTGRTLVAVAALEQVGLITAADRGGAKFWELVPATGKKNLADAPILKCLEER